MDIHSMCVCSIVHISGSPALRQIRVSSARVGEIFLSPSVGLGSRPVGQCVARSGQTGSGRQAEAQLLPAGGVRETLTDGPAERIAEAHKYRRPMLHDSHRRSEYH